MRLGIVRTDINRVYLSDIENSSQRNFSSEPPGQSRYFSRPSDAQLTAALTSGGAVSNIRGTTTTATKATNGPSNVLSIRASATAAFTAVTVTSGAAQPVATVVSELNAGFLAAGLPFLATLVGTNQVQIESTVKGPSSYLEINATATSTINTPLGYPNGVVINGLTPATLRTAVYPTATTINVASATITALSASPAVSNATFANLTANQQTSIVNAVADAVAPKLIETGRALLSFDRGIISKLRSASFQPGGSRSGLPAGIAAAVVANDGSTVFTV